MRLVKEITQWLDSKFPKKLAADWDNVGLLLGDEQHRVDSILTCLTITPPVVEEAIEKKCSLIVSHHPILFKGTKNLLAQRGEGKLLWPLVHQQIAVYSPHTAFDNAETGINAWTLKTLGIQHCQPLRSKTGSTTYKLVVFTPSEALEAVSAAMFAARAGVIGNYLECSFRTKGIGTFHGNEETNPTIGQAGRREQVEEERLEVLVPADRISAVIQALRKAHPYEEPAFDVYPLYEEKSNPGEGCFGSLSQTSSLKELAEKLKQQWQTGPIGIVGDASKPIRSIAVACGAGGEFLQDAMRVQADLFITGEMRFHDLLAAQQSSTAVLLLGHYWSERPAIEMLATLLQHEFGDLQVHASQVERDPISWL